MSVTSDLFGEKSYSACFEILHYIKYAEMKSFTILIWESPNFLINEQLLLSIFGLHGRLSFKSDRLIFRMLFHCLLFVVS